MNWIRELTKHERYHLISLVLGLFFSIGSYWGLRCLKDALFEELVGLEWQPVAKLSSLVFISLWLMVYAKTIDIWPVKTIISRWFGGFFIVCVLLSIWYLVAPLAGQGICQFFHVPGVPLGWIIYWVIEASGSLLVSLFWSSASSSTSPALATRAYPLVIALAQLGSILGSSGALWVPTIGFAPVMLVASTGFLFAPICLLFSPLIQQLALNKKERTGFLEGLKAIVTKPYLLGVLLVANFYEIPMAIFDLQMKLQAREVLSVQELAAFMGRVGQLTNLVPMILALFSTSFLLRRLGVVFCLLLFPLVLFALAGVQLIGSSLWVSFIVYVMARGLSYGLHNPIKEMLFIPMTHDEKFKAKSWIDSFGGRTSKAFGAMINSSMSQNLTYFMQVGSVVAAGSCIVALFMALWTGRAYMAKVKEEKA